jgi:hypothetical protein
MDKQDVPPWDTLENLSVQSPLVRGVWGSEQKAVFPGDLSSLVGRPSSREGARACAPGAASDRMGKRRKAPYSKFGVTAKPLLSTLSSLLSRPQAAVLQVGRAVERLLFVGTSGRDLQRRTTCNQNREGTGLSIWGSVHFRG